MTEELEIQRLVRGWLVASLDDVPEPHRTIARVAERLPATPQVRTGARARPGAWVRPAAPSARRPGSDPGNGGRHGGPVRRATGLVTHGPRLVAAAAVAGMAVAGALLLASLSGGAPDGPAMPSARASAVPSATVGATAHPSPASAGRDIILAADGSGEATTFGSALALAQDGDRILVRPGTYAANGTIRRDVIIEGTGEPGTVVLELSTLEDAAGGSFPVRDNGYAPGALVLSDTAATLRDLTLRASGDWIAALVIGAGAPTLERVTVEDTRSDIHAGPAISLFGGSTAVIRDSVVSGWIAIGVGSSPVIERSRVAWSQRRDDGGFAAISVGDEGSRPRIRDSVIESANNGIAVADGAAPFIEGNQITAGEDGVRVVAADPELLDNKIRVDGDGVSLAGGAARLSGNTIEAALTGIVVTSCATPTIEQTTVRSSAVGLRVDACAKPGGATVRPVMRGNTVCGNAKNAVISAGVAVDRAAAGICEDGAGPSPAPGSAPVFETVEPGVERLVDDGAGHHPTGGWGIAIGPDGTTWVLGGPGRDDLAVYRVGMPGSERFRHPIHPVWTDVTAGPDGSLWVLGDAGVGRLDGTTWTWYPIPAGGTARALDVGPDGSPWVAWMEPPASTDPHGAGPVSVGRLGPDGWQLVGAPLDRSLRGDLGAVDLAVTPDGDAWLAIGDRIGPSTGGLLHLVDGAWLLVDPIGDGLPRYAGALAAGPGGTFWAYLWEHADDRLHPSLARLEDDRWSIAGSEAGVSMVVASQAWGARVAADAGGTLWLAVNGPMAFPPAAEAGTFDDPQGRCPGVLAFDGSTWRQLLAGECAQDVAVAPDGSVWAVTRRTDESGRVSGGVYRIRP